VRVTAGQQSPSPLESQEEQVEEERFRIVSRCSSGSRMRLTFLGAARSADESVLGQLQMAGGRQSLNLLATEVGLSQSSPLRSQGSRRLCLPPARLYQQVAHWARLAVTSLAEVAPLSFGTHFPL